MQNKQNEAPQISPDDIYGLALVRGVDDWAAAGGHGSMFECIKASMYRHGAVKPPRDDDA